jgi:hypothetical protein
MVGGRVGGSRGQRQATGSPQSHNGFRVPLLGPRVTNSTELHWFPLREPIAPMPLGATARPNWIERRDYLPDDSRHR